MKPDPSDNQYLIPGLSAAGLLATGLAGIILAFVTGSGIPLFAAALAFTSLGYLSK